MPTGAVDDRMCFDGSLNAGASETGVTTCTDGRVDAQDTPLYCRVESHPESLTVDYHCAWDQGDQLWMIYLNRIVPAERVLNRPGSVVIWTNCRHPYYAKNPFPALAPRERAWVGDYWPFFYAGHSLELANLKAILEHRTRHSLPLGPQLLAADPLSTR